MAMLPRAIRAFEFTTSVDIYRVAGRRPTDVWVDGSGKLVAPGPGAQPLKELVYWHTHATVGEQLQERLGGLFLVTPEGVCLPVVLSPPQPIVAETAFGHAQVARAGDNAAIDALIASGALIPVRGYRVMHHPSRPGDRLVPADHALVVEDRPEEFDELPAMQNRRARFARS